jgi:hypothetical protein
MRALDRRLRKLEVRFLPAVETEASRQYYDVVLTVAQNRARMRGEPCRIKLRDWSGRIRFAPSARSSGPRRSACVRAGRRKRPESRPSARRRRNDARNGTAPAQAGEATGAPAAGPLKICDSY